jgi:hypothetical protein
MSAGLWPARYSGIGNGWLAPGGWTAGGGRICGDGAGAGDGRSPRPAVEIYLAGYLADVVVETHIAPQVLRGARQARWNGRPFTIAWGRLPADGSGVTVTFARGLLRPAAKSPQLVELTPWCWLAVADGRYHRATATGHGTGTGHSRKIDPVPLKAYRLQPDHCPGHVRHGPVTVKVTSAGLAQIG